MDHEQSKDSHAILLKRWIDVLHRWEEKKSQYQIELDRTVDAGKQQELEQGIDACENVIQTSQGLIQALSDRDLSTFTDAELTALETPSFPAKPSANSPAPVSSPLFPPPEAPNSSSSLLPLAPSSSAIEPVRPSSSAHTRSSSRSIKSLLKIGIPVLLIAAAGLAIFRPRNVCKLAPSGQYSETGLATRVQQALLNSDYAAELQSISIGQYGCTIVLKGTVPNVEVQRNIVSLTQAITLPSQSPIEQAKRALGMESAQIKPVQDVVSELTVKPDPAGAQ